MTGASEFHFTDIYSGRRAFKGAPLDKRLAFIGFMAYIFVTYKFPIFVQTFDPDSADELRKRGNFPDCIGPFNLKNMKSLHCYFLFIRVKWHLEQAYDDDHRLSCVFVDEGFRKNGIGFAMPTMQYVFIHDLI